MRNGPDLGLYFRFNSLPLIHLFTSSDVMAPHPENRIFWPAMAAISVVLVVQNRSRFTLPPHMICLLAYLAFAGASCGLSARRVPSLDLFSR